MIWLTIWTTAKRYFCPQHLDAAPILIPENFWSLKRQVNVSMSENDLTHYVWLHQIRGKLGVKRYDDDDEVEKSFLSF